MLLGAACYPQVRHGATVTLDEVANGSAGKPSASVPWCERGPIPVDRRSVEWGREGNTQGLAKFVRRCMGVLHADGAEYLERTIWDLRLDDRAFVVEMCLLGTTLPPTARFLQCVRDGVLGGRARIPSPATTGSWTLVTILQ